MLFNDNVVNWLKSSCMMHFFVLFLPLLPIGFTVKNSHHKQMWIVKRVDNFGISSSQTTPRQRSIAYTISEQGLINRSRWKREHRFCSSTSKSEGKISKYGDEISSSTNQSIYCVDHYHFKPSGLLWHSFSKYALDRTGTCIIYVFI